MKKYLSIIAAFLAASCFTACGTGGSGSAGAPSPENGNTGNGADNIQIVTTIFPEYDWVRNILGDNPAKAELTMLLDSGVDLHSFQPTAQDILKISSCDIFVYVGGESDEWVEDALGEAVNQDMTVINLLDILGDSAKEEELVEGMQGEEDEEHGDDAEDSEDAEDTEHGEEEGPEYDEHVWLSLRNAALFTDSLTDALCSLDPGNAPYYKENAGAYKEKLLALDSEYTGAVKEASMHTLLFGDRFPFRYMTDDYGLDYYAAFVGCSAETEASFETVSFLAKKTDELGLHTVMTIEGTDHRIAETIVENTKNKDQQILTMNSIQSVTAKDVEEGADYLEIMGNNLSVLKDALK